YLGGVFEFMGVAVRAKEFEQRRPEMIALAKALTGALKAVRTMSGEQIVAAFPKEMITGLDLKEFAAIIARHRDALYPGDVTIDLDAAKRVEQSRRRRPAQGRCQHGRAARHVELRKLNPALLSSAAVLRRRAGPRTSEPHRLRGPVRQPSRTLRLGQIEPVACRHRLAAADRGQGRTRC